MDFRHAAAVVEDTVSVIVVECRRSVTGTCFAFCSNCNLQTLSQEAATGTADSGSIHEGFQAPPASSERFHAEGITEIRGYVLLKIVCLGLQGSARLAVLSL